MIDLKPLECMAAVAWQPNEGLSIETITVLPPRCDEVRVKLYASGVCHTDAYTLSGRDPEGNFPVILGHEGAGIVYDIGPNVQEFRPGDKVVLLYIPQCMECKFCKSSRTNLCSKIRNSQGKGLMPDGSVRFFCNDKPIFHFMGCSSFSEFTVVSIHSLCKIPEDAPLDRVCLLGCGISTGYGAALNTARVSKGSTVAIWGLGTVGLAVAMGCREAGASRIIGIDTDANKFTIASKFGVTECVNPSEVGDRTVVDYLCEITDGGLDFTFECVGNVKLMRDALECCHKGWGVSTVIGVAGSGEEISTRPFQLVTGRVWMGSAFGGWKSKDSVPMLVGKYMQGELMVDEFVTGTISLREINSAFQRSVHEKKVSLRSVIKY